MSRISISPLIDCQWSQYAPYYNNLKIGGKYRLVGCTALAIAQILYYWMVQRGYHRGCKATPKYTTATEKLAIDALPNIMVFDWRCLVPRPRSAAEKKAVATLCEYIAKALRSDFGKSATSAKRTLVETVINSYLRLGNSRHVYQATVGAAQLDELIYDDLAHGRPVYLSGSSSKSGAHSFVVDGYDATTGMYHINWGWGGQDDGYYKLSALKPDGENFSGSKMAVINIEPQYKLGDANGDGIINVADVVTVINHANKNQSSKATDINSDGKTTIEDANIISEHLIKGGVL